MIALVIGQMHFEQLQILVDVLHQAHSLHHQVHRADTPAVHRPSPLRHFITNVAGLEHRASLVFPVLGPEPAFDSLLAMAEDLAIRSIHSKWPFVGCCCLDTTCISTNIYGHFELFIQIQPKITLVWGLAL